MAASKGGLLHFPRSCYLFAGRFWSFIIVKLTLTPPAHFPLRLKLLME